MQLFGCTKFFYEIFFAGMKNAWKFEVVERSQSHDRQRSRIFSIKVYTEHKCRTLYKCLPEAHQPAILRNRPLAVEIVLMSPGHQQSLPEDTNRLVLLVCHPVQMKIINTCYRGVDMDNKSFLHLALTGGISYRSQLVVF